MASAPSRSPRYPTLNHLLRERAVGSPDRGLVYLPQGEGLEERFSHASLDRQARRLAGRLSDVGQPGDRVALLFGEGTEVATAFFGTVYAGMVAVPLTPPQPNKGTGDMLGQLQDAGARILLTSAALAPMVQTLAGPELTVLIVTNDDAGAGETPAPLPYDAQPESLACLLYTSGSTTRPRGVMLSHGHMMARLESATHLLEQRGESLGTVTVSWMPLFHIWGLLAAVLQPMYLDIGAVVLPTSAVMQRPVRWLRAISHYRATSSGAPTFGFQACLSGITPEEADGLDLSCWRLAPLGAEAIQPDVLRQFAERFGPVGFDRSSYVATYGLSEASATFDVRPGADKPELFVADRAALAEGRAERTLIGDTGVPLVNCGTALPGQRVLIVDPDARVELPDGAVGEIWLQGPLVADGYWNQPEQSQLTFHAALASGEAPFVRSGDLGFLDAGNLYVTGRLKDMLIIHGKNIYAADLEHAAEQAHPALRASGSAAFSVPVDSEERVVLVHEVDPGTGPDLVAEIAAAVRRRIGEHFHLPVQAVVLVERGSLPRTGSGKVQRHVSRQQYLDSTSDPAPT